ncbi:hypothetical protein Agabi119p4_7146 [Agaricus bisporus var. burnettii]|uniref:Uncharacterized protein n=1 Tax=Agaricus bisporus var. burnettii TaxID=192524 RepID=A0A8H7C784_AGABI|nr:hypothetical protein Agabi119p4_7146 [Agaricus bisporus var. burnettii]
MATLQDGFYNIRYVPADSQPAAVDGMYAIGTNLGDAVKVEKPSSDRPGPQTWRIKSIDNDNYIITKEEEKEFNVLWGLQTLHYTLPSTAAENAILLKDPGGKFALEPKNGVVTEDAVYSMRVRSDPGIEPNGDFFVTVTDQTVMAQESLIQDIPYIWKFEFVRPI